MLTEVKINGVDISQTGTNRLVKWLIKEDFGTEIRMAQVILSKNIFLDLPTLRNGMAVTIKRGLSSATEQFVFDGTIDKIEKSLQTVKLQVRDQMMTLVNKTVNYSYDGLLFPSTEAKGSDIAEDLIETWGNMTAVVVDTGNVLTIDKFICNNTDVFSRLKVLADIYDYMIYYDPDDQSVHFEPKGTIVNSNILYVGGALNNVSEVPKWLYDNEECINKLTVKGAVQEVQDEQFFNGDGTANQEFTLSKKPIVVQVFEGATQKIAGVEDSTSGAFDYTIDKEKGVISCTSNWTPASGSNNVKVIYTNAIPAPIQVDDEDSQDKYGIIESVKFFEDIRTVEDALTRGQSWLSRYSEPFISTQLKPTSLIDYEAGQKVTIIDVVNDENRELLVTEIKKAYPHQGDIITVGDKTTRLAEWGVFTLERIRRLEERNERDSDLIVSVKNFSHNATKENGYIYEQRYLEAYTKTLTQDGEGFVLGHPNRGILGTNTLGDALGAEVLIKRQQGNCKYKEVFADTDFKDTATTATWNTTTRRIVF